MLSWGDKAAKVQDYKFALNWLVSCIDFLDTGLSSFHISYLLVINISLVQYVSRFVVTTET